MADTNCKSLIIQNLDPRITEDALKGIFALISPTSSVKITEDDKNVSFQSFNL
jgi:nucleolysin TIA-1/TIAR